MPNQLQMAGALAEPSNFAPLHTNRMFTGLWTNRSFLRDAATSVYEERFGMGRQDSIWDGQNSEITPRLTLARRAGTSVFTYGPIPRPNRFYSFNTFTLTQEVIHVMADTANTVYDATPGAVTPIFTKSAGALSTYFLGVGNTLYMANGVDNVQWNYDPATSTGTISKWGIDAPANKPTLTQAYKANPYGSWKIGVCFARSDPNGVVILDSNGNIQVVTTYGTTGANSPNNWATVLGGTTTDGTVTWTLKAIVGNWQPNTAYAANALLCEQALDGTGKTFFWEAQNAGTSGSGNPNWTSGLNSTLDDNGIVWKNIGAFMYWDQIGTKTLIQNTPTIVDSNGYLQQVLQCGTTGTATPTWGTIEGAITVDPTGNSSSTPGTVVWINNGPFAIPATAPVYYGYAFENSKTDDISNMSPKSDPIQVVQGNQVTVTGKGSDDPQIDTIPIYRTLQGGATFGYIGQVANPGAGQTWTFVDTSVDADVNLELQAQIAGEGTPLPSGATCLGYHLGRIFAAVGNVVYISSGPDAIASGSSGNAGFDTSFTAQSKIMRFWTCSLGMVVFTVRDAYIILGSGTAADPLYMVVFIEELPLRSYDCFTVNKTTPYLLLGNNMLVSLDPSAGIIEIGFPIADRLEAEYDASSSYVTFNAQSSTDTALYVANGNGQWYRMAANNAPEHGSSWSTRATLAGFNMGCVQSVEVKPGVFSLLIGSTADNDSIYQRDKTKATDNGNAYPAWTQFGAIVLAQPGQLACLNFLTLESENRGSKATVALLLGEKSGTFETLNRTRQDPPILPPSDTIFSDRYHFAQNQKEAWCRHFQMQVSWPAEDAFNELLTYTIFGQTWNEFRSQ